MNQINTNKICRENFEINWVNLGMIAEKKDFKTKWINFRKKGKAVIF